MEDKACAEKIYDDKIEWLGIDGLLIGSYVISCIILFLAIVLQNDLIIGYILPIGIMAVVTIIFISYLREIRKFASKNYE